MLLPTSTPSTMRPSFAEMSVPRREAGDISLMYDGAPCMLMPMPMP